MHITPDPRIRTTTTNPSIITASGVEAVSSAPRSRHDRRYRRITTSQHLILLTHADRPVSSRRLNGSQNNLPPACSSSTREVVRAGNSAQYRVPGGFKAPAENRMCRLPDFFDRQSFEKLMAYFKNWLTRKPVANAILLCKVCNNKDTDVYLQMSTRSKSRFLFLP